MAFREYMDILKCVSGFFPSLHGCFVIQQTQVSEEATMLIFAGPKNIFMVPKVCTLVLYHFCLYLVGN